MKIFYCVAATATALFLTGCVSRTVSEEPQHRGAASSGGEYGSSPHSKVVEKKLIWIWQDEFRNPK